METLRNSQLARPIDYVREQHSIVAIAISVHFQTLVDL